MLMRDLLRASTCLSFYFITNFDFIDFIKKNLPCQDNNKQKLHNSSKNSYVFSRNFCITHIYSVELLFLMKKINTLIALLAVGCESHSIPLGPLQDTATDSRNDSGTHFADDSGTEYTNTPVTITNASAVSGYVYQSQEATLAGSGTIADADIEYGDTHTATFMADDSLDALVLSTTASVTETAVAYQIIFAQVPWESYPSGTILGTATLTVCDVANSCASETITITGYAEAKTATYTANQDVKVLEENPTNNYEGSSLIIGTSTAVRERSLVSFDVTDIANVYVTDATMTIYALSGTCRSSTNNQNCEKDMVAVVYRPTVSWDAATATWDSAAEAYNAALVGQSATMNLPYGGSGSYDISITSAVQQWILGTNTGLLLKNSDEVTSGDQQVDVVLGSLEEGNPAMLNVSYWK